MGGITLLALLLLSSPEAPDPSPPLVLDRRLEAPEDRQDPSVYRSAPSALHLDASDPDSRRSLFRFPEEDLPFSRRTLRLWSAYLLSQLGSGIATPPPDLLAWRGERLRLRLHYLIAAGTLEPVSVRVCRYRDTTFSWQTLGRQQIALTVVGRWTAVDEVIACEPDANRYAIEVRVASEAGIGECWIDDVSLTPVGEPITVGP